MKTPSRIHGAPWSRSLAVSSILATALCGGVGIGLPLWITRQGVWWIAPLMLALPVLCSGFLVRGYRIMPTAILILRPGWTTRLPRKGLVSAELAAGATRRSVRLFGNGGFFSFTGLFWNKELGRYRAFVTDPRRAVILRYADRTVVVSPEFPAEFVRELREASSAAAPAS